MSWRSCSGDYPSKRAIPLVVQLVGTCLLCLFATSGLWANESFLNESSEYPNDLMFDVPGLPDGLSVVTLVNGKWNAMIATNETLLSVSEVRYPRGVSYHHATRQVAWIGADNKLRLRSLNQGETKMLSTENSEARFTQPTFSPSGTSLIVVELPDGKSRSTRIVKYEKATGRWHFLVRKRTAQFEPHLSEPRSNKQQVLYYTTATCVDDCVGMIWELWQKKLSTGQQQQLTLLNSVSKSPRLGADGWLYFSSNKDRSGYHLWRMRPEPGAPPMQLTSGNVKDSDPSPGTDGSVYFIRQSESGPMLMRWVDGQALETINLPEKIEGLRSLELNP